MKKKLTSLALVGAFLGLSWYGNVQAQESSGNKIHFIPNHSYLSQLDVTYKTPDLMSHFLPP
ncbi:hypothetical protein RK273_08135, partial [Streptococcus pneumoniae]|nr:hypothetical protein [Streptococcus pneumoniae]